MLIFVGDKPSEKNIDPNVAFVGTRSYKTLLGWIADMHLSINDIVLINKDKVDECGRGHLFIALGNEAEKELKKHHLCYYKLPHPSGRNLKTNDKKLLQEELQKCKDWINR